MTILPIASGSPSNAELDLGPGLTPDLPRSALLEKRACVMIIEPTASVRHLLTEVVRSLGFGTVKAMASCKDALGYLEVESADWVITPLLSGDEINAMQLLYLRTSCPELKNLAFSLLVDEAEKYVLPMAFTMGLVSFHAKASTRDVFADEINGFMQRLSQLDGNLTLLAGSYFRPWIECLNKPDLLLKVDEAMCQHIPGESTLLANLAQSLYANNQKLSAHRVIRQVEALDPASADLCEQFRSQNPLDKIGDQVDGPPHEQAAKGEGESSSLNVLGVDNVMVIDSDSDTQNMLRANLTKLGVPLVEAFHDGEAAREWLAKNHKPGLVVMEWRIPKISGPAIIQEIRSRGFYNTPVIIISALLSKSDLPLLREMGIATIITKPLSETSLLKGIIAAAQGARHPTNSKAAEIKLRAHLSSGELAEAEGVWTENQEAFDEATKLELLGEFAYVKKSFEEAAKHAMAALKARPDAIFALNLLGKALMRMSDYSTALKCFEKAQAISPQNIERLCNISKVHHALGDETRADSAMNAAKKLDQGAQSVQENKAINAIEANDVLLASQLMKGISQLTNMVSYLNNQAVALAREGRIDDGIVLYQRTLDSIPENRDETVGVVNYNIALAYVRGNRPTKEALKFLTIAMAKAPPDVRERAKSLNQRLQAAGEKKSLKLRATATTARPTLVPGREPGAGANGDVQSTVTPEPSLQVVFHDTSDGLALPKAGDMGLYMIFSQDDLEVDQRARALIAKVPRFARRGKIERGATSDSEKGNAERK